MKIKKVAESFEPITKKSTEMNESTKKEEVFKRNSGNENSQQLVPIEIKLNNSEDEIDNIASNIKALPNISILAT